MYIYIYLLYIYIIMMTFFYSLSYCNVFFSFSSMLSFVLSLPVRELPSPPYLLIIRLFLYQKHLSQLAQSSLSCSSAFSIL